MNTHDTTFCLGKTPKGVMWIALLIGILGLAIAGYGVWDGLASQNERPLISWLIGFSVWFSMAIGMLFFVMMGYLFGASWSVILRRVLEHGISVFPWLGLIFAPLLLVAWFYKENPGILWTWINPNSILPGGELVSQDVLYQAKESLLNLPFFTARAIGYFVLLSILAMGLRKCSFAMDRDGNMAWNRRAVGLSAMGIPLTALIVTFAAVDFFMSLSYHWFSTMYGVWFFATSFRAGLAGLVIACFFLSREHGPLCGIYKRAHSFELGSLCFAFTVFWAYITFCQYFLIYNANIPEETFWYVMRELGPNWEKNSWWFFSLGAIVLCYFFIPFIYLLFYPNKVSRSRFLVIAFWIVLFNWADMYFNILPGKIPADNTVGYIVREFSITYFDVAAIVGVGGICIWRFCRSMGQAAPIPLRDPSIRASIEHSE
jgi:hypothetical protein